MADEEIQHNSAIDGPVKPHYDPVLPQPPRTDGLIQPQAEADSATKKEIEMYTYY